MTVFALTSFKRCFFAGRGKHGFGPLGVIHIVGFGLFILFADKVFGCVIRLKDSGYSHNLPQ